ncbi:RNA polymerase III transcription initiation factor complex subunit [Aspergillus wentii]|nr:RNA polymerase III transcription initiation factor complex subunit [Aspergillus wentii]
MAPSLRDLIDFLLAEIALCGDQGASSSDVLSFIDAFYKKAQDAKHRNHLVDRRFQEKVWSWLTRNPEVSVGKNKESNHLSLNDVEQATRDADPDHPPVRVFVSEQRTWLAITGHEPDETKVLPTEFALLSIIASHKSDGVAQTELVKLSGQDKRSVPKRTDMLQQKGYIEKRAIQIKSARTSLCTLRKFLKQEPLPTETPVGDKDQGDKIIDFAVFNEKLFKILREFKVISRIDLKQMLGFADAWRWRVLSRALRKFERVGVLKRVRAMSQYADTMKKFHPCVMLIRDPTERDMELFHEFSRSIFTNIGREDNAELDEDVDGAIRQPDDVDTVSVATRSEENVEEAGRTLPTWTPDRNIHNMLFDTVDGAGISGRTNYSIIRTCFGSFFRRPLENALTRLVECWQLSQPLHLRHLAIVRDTALDRTVTHYVHYSTTNFQKLVDAGEAPWEAVEFVPKGPKDGTVTIPPVDATPELDEYGLPITGPTKELFRDGNSTLLECMAVVKPVDYVLSGSDPLAIRQEDGTYSVRYGHQKLPSGTLHRIKTVGRPKGTPNRPKLEDLESQAGAVDDAVDEELVFAKPKKPKHDPDRFKGMTEKEKLEALGLDETWTEYSILLIDRPTPGVYITPRGRRRPAGKRQGRPRISRLAVFKSPQLKALPWFVEQEEEQENTESVSQRDSQAPGTETPAGTPAREPTSSKFSERRFGGVSGTSKSPATPSRRGKRRRGLQRQESFEAESVPGSARSSRGPSKQRRLNEPERGSQDVIMSLDRDSEIPKPAEDIPVEDTTMDTAETPVKELKRKRAQLPKVTGPAKFEASEVVQDHIIDPTLMPTPQEDQTKRPRRDSQPPQDQVDVSVAPVETPKPPAPSEPSEAGVIEKTTTIPPTTPSGPAIEQDANLTLNGQQDSIVPDAPVISEEVPESGERDGSMVQEGKWFKRKTDKGGSIAFLRRKIIMEIIEKAGGAYPMGTELWYPFMTAWKKTKHKEKPDLRTIRNSVKQMVDSGKIRQLTFSGKDSKGVMVTKKILVKAELAPDDAIIQDLQKNMLSTEERFYFPPNTEIDADVTKSGGRTIARRNEPKIVPQLPVETGVTVHLQTKPAFVVAQEKRRGQSIHRKLLHSLGLESESPRQRRSKVVRLLKIQRGSTMSNLTSISRPHGDEGIEHVQRRRAPGGMKRLLKPISSLGPYAMSMNPKQVFHPTSGTFGTHAGLAALRVRPWPREAREARETRETREVREKPAFELPQSLEELFHQTRRRSLGQKTETRRFFSDNDVILRWELQNEELLEEARTEDLHYINQSVQYSFEPAPIDGDIRFALEDTGHEVARIKRRVPPRKKPPRRPQNVEMEPAEPDVYEPSKYVPQNRRLTKLSELMTTDGMDASMAAAAGPATRQPARRMRVGYQVSHMLVQKVLTAIVAVRTLAGGTEGRSIDWSLVAKAFPGYDPKFIQERGKAALNKSRLQAAKMQSDFQERFIEAYENGQVPSINYEYLESYDWEGVVEWATTQLDVPTSEKLPDLPATREQFDGVFELREEAPTTVDEIYQNPQSLTVYRKRTLFAGVPFAVPLEDRAAKTTPRKEELSRLDAAKTWVRANIITPEETYRPAEARQALEVFGDAVIGSAVQSLVTERAISMGNGGRIMPGRNYDITDHFIFTLGRKRAIESTQLRRAARFKTEILDPELRERGTFDVKYSSEDGDILALINLAAEGKVTLKPRDPPREKYGLTDGGYLTRQMDKDKLRFSIEAQPIQGAYVYGNPIQERMSSLPPPCPPRVIVQPTISLPEKIPIWLDIHGEFVKVLWDLVIATVAGCVAMRPGISAVNIGNMVKPMMGVWEVQLLLEWMAAVDLVRRVGEDAGEHTEWVVQEWWWMVLG